MISPDTIAAVRDRTDIVALIGENVRLKKQGRRHLGLCPFHKEKTPSFTVNAERRMFYCFGCKESGSAIDYVMKMEGCSFPEAVRALADRCGLVVEETGSADVEEAARRRKGKEELYELNQLAATYFEQQLAGRRHPLARHARAELERRGMPFESTDEAIVKSRTAFRVGYAPYGWDGLVGYLRQQGIEPGLAERLGLICARSRGDGYYDAFRHRLMFAVTDKSGRVVAFSGRALPEPSADELAELGIVSRDRRDASDRRAPPKYINSPESPIYVKGATVFGLYQARTAVRQRGCALLVEGNFDVLSLHARGVDHAVAPLGTAVTVEQARLIRRYAPAAVVMFDGDAAGRKATRAARKPALEAGLTLKVAVLPSGTDPDDYVQQHGAEALEGVFKGAQGMLEHLIEETLGGAEVRAGSLREKQQRIQQVMKLLADERDPTVRTMAKAYADKISSQLVVGGQSPADMRSLEQMVKRALHRGEIEQSEPFEPRPEGSRARSQPRVEGISLAVLGALFDFPELGDEPDVQDALSHLGGAAALGVAALRQVWDEKKALEVEHLLDLMPRAIHPFAVARLASPAFGDLAEARRELLDNTKKLRRLSLKDDKAVKMEALVQAERLGDSAAEDELLSELVRRSREKHGLN